MKTILSAALLAGFAAAALPLRAAELTVSAAASLTNALREIAPLFEAAHPEHKLRLNFGASGALLQQIARGAPVDVFVTADQETMDQAQAQNLIAPGTRRDIVSNTLVVVLPATSKASVTALRDLTGAGFARIAIGRPASVPVGRYTREALQQARLWAAVDAKMVGAQNVRQALDYVRRGEVDAAFVYATDAALMPETVRLALTVPTERPIRYPAAAVAAAANAAAARQFIDFLVTPSAQRVFSRHGFGAP